MADMDGGTWLLLALVAYLAIRLFVALTAQHRDRLLRKLQREAEAQRLQKLADEKAERAAKKKALARPAAKK